MNHIPEPLQQLARADLSPAEAQQLVQPLRSFSLGALQQTLVQGGITIDGSYNVIGHNNLILSGEGAKALVALYRELLERDRALHQLPAPPPDFTGRGAELDELLTASNSGGVVISGIQGMGGIGKTVLALKLAEQIKDRYPDAQFFLNLEGASAKPLASRDAMAHVIRAYEPLYQMPEHEAEIRGKYLSVLHDRRALLVLDNAANEEQVAPLLPPAGCALLVTSRQHFVLDGMQAKRLEAMTTPDACALLVRIAPRIGAHAGKFAELCGNLPLALRLVASALQVKRNLKPEAYAERLERTGLQLLDKVEAAFQLSYDLLQPEQQRLWCRLSVMRGTFDDAAAAAVWELTEEEATDKLGDLLAYSLVEWNDEISRYHLHDLTRLFAKARLSDEERRIAERQHATHYQVVLAEAESLYLQGHKGVRQGITLFEVEWNNIEAGQRWAATQANEDKTAAQLAIAYPLEGGNLLLLRHPAHERIVWLERALTSARRLEQRGNEGSVLNNLGIAYKALGKLRRAIDYYEELLRIAREMGDRHGEVIALGNIGNVYYLLEGLKLSSARVNPERRGRVGNVYYLLEGLKQAIDYHEQDLIITREIGDRRGEGITLGNIGIAYDALKESQRAISYHEQALTIAREIGDRHSEGRALGNLGAAHHSLGKFQEAIDYHKQRFTITREMGDRQGESEALGNLGVVYFSLGERNYAINCHEQRLAIAREINDRLGEGTALWNLSLVFASLGVDARAISYAENAIAILEQIETPLAAILRAAMAEWKAPASPNGEEVD